MRPRLACAVLVVALVAPAYAQPSPRWTFCVASAIEGKDVWISDVFAATRDRERLESELKAYLQQRETARVDAQCPEAKDDKTAVVNAQFAAAEFNRKLGAALHEVPARAFGAR